jgi:Family of unknown function (DUF6328)
MERESLSLESATSYILEECRMVLPGIQTLLGFQLIAVFNDGFRETLSRGEQLLHLAAIVLVTVAIALVMAPAALHRQSEPRSVSERFINVSSTLLLAGMFPLALGISLDVYLISAMIMGTPEAGGLMAGALLLVFAALWLWLPARERRLRRL